MKSYYYSALVTMHSTGRVNTGIFETEIKPTKKDIHEFIDGLKTYIEPQIPEEVLKIDILGWALLN